MVTDCNTSVSIHSMLRSVFLQKVVFCLIWGLGALAIFLSNEDVSHAHSCTAAPDLNSEMTCILLGLAIIPAVLSGQ